MAKEEPQQGQLLPMVFEVPEDIVSRYATNIVIQQSGQEFIVSFFEANPPIVLGTAEESRATMERLGEVRARCVARVVVSPGRMKEFVRVFQDSLSKYLAASSEQDEC